MLVDRKHLLRTVEAAHLLGLHPLSIYRLIGRGELPLIKLGSQYRFIESDLAAWIEDRKSRRTKAEGGGNDQRRLA